MTDERPESLAAQAASWVPPWERAAREPDRSYQAAAADPDNADELDEAGLADDDDDFDESFEGPNPAEYAEEVPPELEALPGESSGPATVDAPRELPGEEAPEPTDVPGGAELPVPTAVEDASEENADPGAPVDGPTPAGEVFDRAADDDPNDADELDLPVAEIVPDEEVEEPAALDADETAAPGVEGLAEPGVEGTAGLGAGEAAPVVDDVAALGTDETAALDADDAPLPEGRAAGSLGASPTEPSDAGAGAPTDADAPSPTEELVSIEGGSSAGGDLADRDDAPADDSSAGGASGGGSAGGGASVDGSPDAGSQAGDSAGGGSLGGSSDGRGPGAGDGGGVDPSLAAGGGAERARRARPSSGIPAQGRGGGAPGSGGESWSRTEEIDSEVPAMDDGELRAALEAILLVVDEPVAEMQLAQIMEQPTERVAGLLEDISARYTAAGHGFDLRRAAGGWRLYTRPEYAPYVERFVLDGQSVRLTQAALETLAVVAYKQPVTRSRISAIRGVNCDGVMRTLVTRGLIEECGTESETGAFLYRTTPLFLEKLGLNSVDQLPPLAPFLPDDVEEVLDASG